MTTPPNAPGAPPRPGEEDPAAQLRALASTLAGLGREMEQLRRDQANLRKATGRVDDLARVVQQLADTLAAGNPSSAPSHVAPSWLDFDTGPTDDIVAASEILAMLSAWVAGVYLRYSDARLPDCWLWHPDVVEELLWLHTSWLSAYHPEAPVTAVGDWHDRQRPGVAARIKAYAGMCSLEAHQPGQDRALPAPVAPTADAIPSVAAWWATRRDQPGPHPSAEQMETARQRIMSRGHR
jgi:hypothetical protein